MSGTVHLWWQHIIRPFWKKGKNESVIEEIWLRSQRIIDCDGINGSEMVQIMLRI